LNRSPTLAVKDMTPEEAWSGQKPFVHHFRVFGCLAHVHVHDVQRKKLDSKSITCVNLGVSEESKAYKVYDPVNDKVFISRDVVFDESKGWNWQSNSQNTQEGPSGVDSTSDDEDVITPATAATDDIVVDTDEVGESSDDDDDAGEMVNNNGETSQGAVQKRVRRPPGYLEDFVTGSEAEQEEQLHNLAIFSSSDDPSTYEEAAKSEIWRKAMDQEIDSIESNNTWELTALPLGAKTIGVKWIYKTKYNEKGEVEKHKARLVAKGYTQKYGIDYGEVFAPVARWDTIRTILSIAASKKWCVFQLDVKSAFLHGELVEEVYIDKPAGYHKGGSEMVYRLKKALYGLRQAPRAWYSKIESYFCAEKFEKCTYEPTLFVKNGVRGKILIVSLYVDDLIYTGNDLKMIEEFKESMKGRFAMTDLGKMRYFLGVEVSQNEKGIFIFQHKYASEILSRFGMKECNKVCSPIVPGCKLVKDENGKASDSTTYKQMVGCLMYLLATRPDIAFSVCLVARYMERPTEIHVAAVKRIMRYLKGSLSFGIWYRSGDVDDLQMIGWTDSDYAGDSDDRKSTSGYVFKLASGAISWSSKKQPIVTLSTTEAEFVAAASSACQAVWLRNVLSHLGCNQKNGSVILCDNSSSIKLSKNPVMHGRCKHIDVRYHFLRDLTRDNVIELRHCSSQDQLADVLTKPLKLESYCRLREGLGVVDLSIAM
jgi:hypothetical protein